MIRPLLIIFSCAATLYSGAQKTFNTDVLVVGGGTGGTAAGIQSARLGATTIIAEPTTWLGGMISAAGVSAIDGNHRLPSGLWGEFRSQLYKVYGGPLAVETGWVSNTLFEPHVADSIFKAMAAKERKLKVLYQLNFLSVNRSGKKIHSVLFSNSRTGEKITITAKTYIDATELGDVIKATGLAYDLGMEAGVVTGETVGVNESNDIVQDLTYVAILKDYGKGADKTISKPAQYNPSEFDGSSSDYYVDKTRKAPSVDAKKMLEYGKLPNNKYMINWPIYGNDTYLNVVEMTDEQRSKELEKAKQTTLRFVYFIQQQLGFKNLGLADDEFRTSDKLAFMPYHRESRRVKGLVRFTMRHISEPFSYGEPLYRTGISVGDYPIDHHHKKNLAAPQHLEFYPIPSYSIPLGTLIPAEKTNLIVAEKSLSVSNVANGTTRLQPVVLITGQAAGTVAALSVLQNKNPRDLAVRSVQQSLLKSGAYLMPYIDVTPDQPYFEAVQKIGATGILKGTGIPYKWANQTWFYPDSLVETAALLVALNDFKKANYVSKQQYLTVENAIDLMHTLSHAAGSVIKKMPNASVLLNGKSLATFVKRNWNNWGLKNFERMRNITRAELAVMFVNTVDPFRLQAVDYKGRFVRK